MQARPYPRKPAAPSSLPRSRELLASPRHGLGAVQREPGLVRGAGATNSRVHGTTSMIINTIHLPSTCLAGLQPQITFCWGTSIKGEGLAAAPAGLCGTTALCQTLLCSVPLSHLQSQGTPREQCRSPRLSLHAARLGIFNTYLVLFANRLIRGMVWFYLALTVGPA